MRIYNKKGFAFGVFMVALGIVNLVADLADNSMEVDGIILVAALFLFGFGMIARSLSRTLAREGRLEERDERNRLIELRSKSRSFQITQVATLVLIPVFLVMGKLSGHDGFIGMGTGLGFAFSISMFAEIATFCYYESKS